MKKKLAFFITLLTVIVFSCVLFACTPIGNTENVTTYTVRFNNNYDGTVTKVDVEAGGTVELIAEPTRTGYIFKGWYLSSDENASEVFDNSKTLTQNVSVYAKWEKDASKSLITLKYLNYTTADEVIAVNKGTAYAKPENPKYDENDMCVFYKWYTDEACTAEYDFTSVVNSDITLYAGWIQKKTTVKFDPNYAGAEVTTSIVELGKPVTKPADPQRDRYEFNGWYTERVGGIAINFDDPVNDKITCYAHWSRSEYVVTFNVNGATLAEGIEKSYVIKRGQSAVDVAAEFVTHMSFEGHDFAGWYKFAIDPNLDYDEGSDEDKADLTAINDDMTVYAKWTLQTYTVSFNLNYDGAPAAPATQSVKYGKLLTEPQIAEREGWMFLGWYIDAEYSQQFTLDLPVKGNMSLYARWMEKPVETTYVKITYIYNIGAGNVTYAEKEVELGATAASNAPDPIERGEYYFAGWFEDQQFTKSFNLNANVTEDITVYGKMLKKHTFEAEAVDFTGKKGQGTSTNSDEEGMIYGSSFIGDGSNTGDSYVSNGWFVRELYYNGAFLNFEIVSNEDVTDAVMFLRVSSESYEFNTTKEKNGKTYNYLSDKEFKIIVNGRFDADNKPVTWLDYGGLYIPMANLVEKEDLSQEKTPFEDCLIAVNIRLKKGINDIMLYVDNNNNHGGTFHAEAPMIDCMYIYSSANLSMTDYEFYTRPNVSP